MASEDLKYHFCYALSSDADLQQGDILRKTDDLKKILKDVHPHYLDESYTHFIVLSQTCDLVRRDGKNCKTRYITLGVVRPLSLLLGREIEKHQDDFDKAAIVCKSSVKSKLSQLLERLLNNNEAEYFYIEPQVEVGLYEPSCAFLRLSISIRAYQHYDACLMARVLSLTEGFRAKLGWMLGNVYSRVGTEDWVPGTLTSKEFHKRIGDTLESMCQWVEDEKLKFAKGDLLEDIDNTKALVEVNFMEYAGIILKNNNYYLFKFLSKVINGLCTKEWLTLLGSLELNETSEVLLRELINQKKVYSKKEIILQRIKGILKEANDFEDARIEKICRRIENDPIISRNLK